MLYFAWRCAGRAKNACPGRKGLGPGDPRWWWLCRLDRWLSVRARALQHRLLPEACPLPVRGLGWSDPRRTQA